MACLYCGKEIGPFRLLRDDEFCSSRHRKEYRERLTRGLLQAQTSDFRANKVAGFENVLRPLDFLVLASARVTKIDPSVIWDAIYTAFPLTVTELAGATLMPLMAPVLLGRVVEDTDAGSAGRRKRKPEQAELTGRSVPKSLIPSPALHSARGAEIEPHDPTAAAADLHVCSSPDAIIAGIENPKLPLFLLEIDASWDRDREAQGREVKVEQPAAAASSAPFAAPEPPPLVVTAIAPPPAQPREVMPLPVVAAAACDWVAPQLALPAADPAALFGPAAAQPGAAQIPAAAGALESPEPRALAGGGALSSEAAAAWNARELTLPSGTEAWLTAQAAGLRRPAMAQSESIRAVAAATPRGREAGLAVALQSVDWAGPQLAMPKAVSEEMFPPELTESEPLAVRPGETPLALLPAAPREREAAPVSAMGRAEWLERSLALPVPAVAFSSGLRLHEASKPLKAAPAEPSAPAPVLPQPIEISPPPAAPQFALEAAQGRGRAIVAGAEIRPLHPAVAEGSALPAGAVIEFIPLANSTVAPVFALEAAHEALRADAAELAPAASSAPFVPAAAVAALGPVAIALPALAAVEPAFAIQAAQEFAYTDAAAETALAAVAPESVAPASFATQPPLCELPAANPAPEAAALDSAPSADLTDGLWSVSEVAFPFEPSLEFVTARSDMPAASAVIEMAAAAAAGAPAFSRHVAPMPVRASVPLLASLALEPEPPAYLTAEPPACDKPLPTAAPAPAAREAHPITLAAPAASIAKPAAPPVVPAFPALHGQDEFHAATANPATALAAAASAAIPEELAPTTAAMPSRMPLRPEVEAVDPDSTSPAGFILLDYHCHGVQAAPVPSFTWRWRIAPTQLPEFQLRTVQVKLEELIDEKKDVVRPFFEAAKKIKARKAPVGAHPFGLIAAALLVAAIVGMGGRMAFSALRSGGSDSQTASSQSLPVETAPQVAVQVPAGPAGRPGQADKKPGAIARLRQVISDRAALELNDTFEKGLTSWGQAKALAPGWVKSKDGYVRPGQLALYQPSLPLSNYNMEFLGQIENKSMDWVVRAKDKQNYYAMKFKVIEPGLRPIIAMVHYSVVNGVAGRKTETPLNIMVHNNTAYHVNVAVEGHRIITAIEGQEVDRWIDDSLPKGGVGFFADAGERARVYWVRVSKNEDFLGRVCAYFAGDSAPAQSVAALFPMEWNHGYGYNAIAGYHN